MHPLRASIGMGISVGAVRNISAVCDMTPLSPGLRRFKATSRVLPEVAGFMRELRRPPEQLSLSKRLDPSSRVLLGCSFGITENARVRQVAHVVDRVGVGPSRQRRGAHREDSDQRQEQKDRRRNGNRTRDSERP
jgi:hypothetical protein